MLLLSDFNREAIPHLTALIDTASGFKQVGRRTVLVVGRDGRVLYRWDNTEPPSLPAIDPVVEALRQAAG
jgi:peroxiredoxin